MTSFARLSSWCSRRLRVLSNSGADSSSAQKKKQRNNDAMDSAPPEKMEQSEALREFIERVDAMSKNNYFSANLEFAKLRSAQENFQVQEEYSMSEGFAAPQNRYRDVVPYNKNRICLKNTTNNNDYINASLIEYPGINQKYIAAQAPLAGTIDDFWHMIGQYKIRVVVMLCNVVENSIVKCVQYWPLKVGEKMDLSFGVLETVKEEQFDHFVCREILFKSERFGEYTVYQLHYTEWPDHGRPDTDLHIPNFVETMDDYQNKHGGEDAPILVHCSAGVGRTGSIIGVDIFRILIRENKITHKIDLKEFVLTLRKQRTAFVQSASQYQLLHALVAHYCKLALEKGVLEDKEPEPLKVDVDQPNGTPSSSVASLIATPSPSKSSKSSKTSPSKKSDDGTSDLVVDNLSIN